MSFATLEKIFDPGASDSSDELRSVVTMEQAQLDELPIGAIRLDSSGKIRGYNRFESRLSGLDPTSVIGKNFFTEVAPCTNVQAFAGRFREGVAKGELHAVFAYHMNFNPPRDVTITLYFHKPTGNAWVLIKANLVRSENAAR